MLPLMQALLDSTIERFGDGFFGYGSWSAPVWIIGMEEGGGGTLEEVRRRLSVWETRGQRELEDLVSYHETLGVTRHVGPDAVLQPTWSKIARLILGARGLPDSTESVRDFQASELGRCDGTTCIVELLPLPSPNIRTWLYAEVSSAEYLHDRKSYRRHFVPSRISRIRTRIDEFQPAVVVFLGLAYTMYWRQVAGDDFVRINALGIATATRNGTAFIAVRHPASRGVTNAYFRSVGEFIAKRLRTESLR